MATIVRACVGVTQQTLRLSSRVASKAVTLSSTRRISIAVPCRNDADHYTATPFRDYDGESEEQKRSRLLYQSRKRGVKEIDLIFSTFASSHLKGFTLEQLDQFDIILNGHDNEWDMYKWLVGQEPIPEYLQDLPVMKKLLEHMEESREIGRPQMPALDHS